MTRFKKCCEFFIKYYENKYNCKKNINKNRNIKYEKIKSITISIYLCYFIRIVEKSLRDNFDKKLKEALA